MAVADMAAVDDAAEFCGLSFIAATAVEAGRLFFLT